MPSLLCSPPGVRYSCPNVPYLLTVTYTGSWSCPSKTTVLSYRMRPNSWILLPLAFLAHPASSQWPSCEPSCKSCGLVCDQGCSSPLNLTECTAKCLYCRRESSSCDWVQLTPPSEPDNEFCEQCYESCWCKIGARCYDNYTSPTTTGGRATATTAKLSPKGLRRI